MGLVDRSTEWADVLGSVRSPAAPAVYGDTIPTSAVGPVPPGFEPTDSVGSIRIHVETEPVGAPARRVTIVESPEWYVVGRRRALMRLVATGSLAWLLAGGSTEAGPDSVK